MAATSASGDRVLSALRFGVAFVWLATGLGVLHPSYRAIGAEYLAAIGLPWWLMVPVCVAEVALGLRVLARPVGTALAVLQAGAIVAFTLILAATDPWLLVHPFGMLTKNLPILGLIAATWLVEREGWTSRATWVLRVGVASIWLTEGLLPKVFFQQPMELAVVARSGLVPFDPGMFLVGLGLVQAASGVAALTFTGRMLVVVLACQAGALVALPALVSWQDPSLWVHPFGPMTKNVPALVGTLVVLGRVRA